MKDYKVKATRYFKDVVENKERNKGDEFECTLERYEFLKDNNAVELVECPKVEIAEIENVEINKKNKKKHK